MRVSGTGWKRRSTIAVASLSAVILAAGAALVGCPQNPLAVGAGIISLGPPPADGQYADLGDYRIFYRQKGQGGTPVILMSGEDENLRIWNQVMDPIAQETSVISYDRGGVGWSDDGYNPRNGTTIVEELRAFLNTINVQPPYVLVAHSLGGLYARLYAHRHPGEIAGIVLIDTTHEDYYRRTSLELTPQSVQTTQLLMGLAQSVVSINQTGALGEYYNIDNLSAEVRANRSLPNVPLLLLSQDFDNLAPLDDAQEAIAVMLLQELYIDQSRLSSKGIWRPVENTSHFIMNDQPQAVIDGVKEVLQGW